MSVKLKTGSKAWVESMRSVLLTYAPPLMECDKCGHVIHSYYVCHCGFDNSGVDNEVTPSEWLWQLMKVEQV